MPSVSDPGYRAVRMVIDKGFKVSVIPGPSAVLAALALSGLPTDSFAFDGFPPRTSGARDQWCEDRAHEVRTLVLFEAPHRISETIGALSRAFGAERQGAIVRSTILEISCSNLERCKLLTKCLGIPFTGMM